MAFVSAPSFRLSTVRPAAAACGRRAARVRASLASTSESESESDKSSFARTSADADALLARMKFNADGLVAAVAQQHDSKEVLMMAWMNEEAVRVTVAEQQVCYYSRSRRKLWRKGESSGNTQALVDVRVDCDGDTLLLLVDQTGPACHTGRRSCCYFAVRGGRIVQLTAPMRTPEEMYGGEYKKH